MSLYVHYSDGTATAVEPGVAAVGAPADQAERDWADAAEDPQWVADQADIQGVAGAARRKLLGLE